MLEDYCVKPLGVRGHKIMIDTKGGLWPRHISGESSH
jgi:hypothetical protein